MSTAVARTPRFTPIRVLVVAVVLSLLSLGLAAGPAQAQVEVATTQTTTGNVFAEGATPGFSVETSADEARWSVRDYWGQEVAAGRAPVSGGSARLRLPVRSPGHYRLQVTAGGGGETASTHTSFAVLPKADRPAAGDVRFGVQTHFGQEGTGWDPEIVPLLRDVGVATARDAQQWQAIETSRGGYDFTVDNRRFERYMSALRRHGIQPLTNFGRYNETYDNGATPYTDEGRRAFGRFAQEVLRHHGRQIRQVGVYNEPNLPHFGDHGDGPADALPEYHVPIADAVYSAVEAERPGVRVTAPELFAPVQKIDGSLAWLEEYFRLGGLDSLDVVSLHPYRRCCAPEGLAGDLARVRGLMRQYGGGDKPIWITEQGWPTDQVSERTQAAYLPRSYVVAFASGVERFYWYNFKDHASGPFGLLYADNSPKPAYVSYGVMTGQLAGRPYRGADDAPDGVRSYRFGGGGGSPVRVMWAPQGSTDVNLTTDRPLRVTDIMGRTRTLRPEDGRVPLTLTGDPLYVRGPAEAPIARGGGRGPR